MKIVGMELGVEVTEDMIATAVAMGEGTYEDFDKVNAEILSWWMEVPSIVRQMWISMQQGHASDLSQIVVLRQLLCTALDVGDEMRIDRNVTHEHAMLELSTLPEDDSVMIVRRTA